MRALQAQKQQSRRSAQSFVMCVRIQRWTVSDLLCSPGSFGVGWVLSVLVKMRRLDVPVPILDLSVCNLKCSDLHMLLSFLPSRTPSSSSGGGGETKGGISNSLEALRCGPRVCRAPLLSVLGLFLQRLKFEGGPGPGGRQKKGEGQWLKTFDLSGNQLRGESLEVLGSVLRLHWLPHLTTLDLSRNPLGPGGLKALSRGIAGGPVLSLQTLRLSDVRAKTEGISVLCEALKAKKTINLESLDLSQNEMGGHGLKHLSAAVTASAVPCLRVLILRDNRLFSDSNLNALSEMLSSEFLPNLEQMDLSENEICPRGASMISSALKTGNLSKLRKIKLVSTLLSGYGVGYLADGLQEGGGPLLQSLDLSGDSHMPCGKGWGNTGLALAKVLRSGRVPRMSALVLRERQDVVGQGVLELCRSLAVSCTPLLSWLELDFREEEGSDGSKEGEAVRRLAGGIREGKLPMLENVHVDVSRAGVSGEAVKDLGLALGSGGVSGLVSLSLIWRETGDEGVGGIAEGLGMGGLPCLRDLSLKMMCGGQEGEACRGLGRVLGSGKIPSLQKFTLGSQLNSGFAFLCEGLSLSLGGEGGAGLSGPASSLSVDLSVWTGLQEEKQGAHGLISCLVKGGFKGLRKIRFVNHLRLDSETGGRLGAAFTSGSACLNQLEEMVFGGSIFGGGARAQEEGMASFLSGMAGGGGRVPSLHTVDMENTALCASGVRALSEVIGKGQVPSLRDLRVRWENVGREGVRAFGSAVSSRYGSTLRNLRVKLQHHALSDEETVEEMKEFGAILSCHSLSGLEGLVFRGTVGIEGMSALAVGLGRGDLASLRFLQIANPLSAERVACLAECLSASKLPSLKQLVFKGTGLKNKGLTALVDVLRKCDDPPPLEELNLEGNEIGDQGAAALTSLLGSGHIPSLTLVSLRNNDRGIMSASSSGMENPGVVYDLLPEAFPDIVEIQKIS
uniref:Uncharacterized protein n=1 Tax=Chromera velia CCMP2878 TaxID=1169474 RepID=A0A0G4HJL1_9ALVE|eukprot:Cvel_28297.t1-p1 / transcript=Cvel_28297.t1 / gene=Cvel_28297 / organism=Chromera_velia_CCMP2878 / gene_product=Protein NLRC3, putative / transcript_product=Protein NLRC3, putative / location=Cvel_scaffold3672:750-6372(-) / protein_length=958 / sequence_SO=supercontig / SO=protein_coding / is_pseudo=false